MSDRGAPQSYTFTAGETVEVDFVTDGDITGATARFWMARSRGGTLVMSTESPLANATCTVTDTEAFTLTITDEDTEDLLGSYAYDVELEDSLGNKTKAAYGFLTFVRQVG